MKEVWIVTRDEVFDEPRYTFDRIVGVTESEESGFSLVLKLNHNCINSRWGKLRFEGKTIRYKSVDLPESEKVEGVAVQVLAQNGEETAYLNAYFDYEWCHGWEAIDTYYIRKWSIETNEGEQQ